MIENYLFDEGNVVLDSTDGGPVGLYVNSPPPSQKRFNLYHQVVAGHYVTGTAVSVSLAIDGRRIGEHILNPNDPRHRILLTRLSNQEVIPVLFIVTREIDRIITILHQRGVRQELKKVLHNTIANNGRVVTKNWEKTLKQFLDEPVNILNDTAADILLSKRTSPVRLSRLSPPKE